MVKFLTSTRKCPCVNQCENPDWENMFGLILPWPTGHQVCTISSVCNIQFKLGKTNVFDGVSVVWPFCSSYDPTTGTFTVPPGGTGFYYFSAFFSVESGEYANLQITANGAELCTALGDNNESGSSDYAQASCGGVVLLVEGELRSCVKTMLESDAGSDALRPCISCMVPPLRFSCFFWWVLANSPQPWKRKRKRNFWYAVTVKSYVCVGVSRLRAVC